MKKYAANTKILQFLQNNPRYSYNAPTIYKHFKGSIKLSTIRCELRRLCEHKDKKIIRETHGFYRYNLDAETLYYMEQPPTLLHGIMVSMEWSRKLQKNIHGITSQTNILDTTTRLKNNGFKQTEGRNKQRLFKKIHYENDPDRLITITVHLNGRLDIYLNCTNHPVNYYEFRDILKYSQGTIDFIGPFGNQKVIQFGIAKDFREIRLDGATCLTLRAFMDSWFRVYNKDQLGVTRMEQHIIRCNVSPDTFVSMFERMFLPIGNGVVHHEDDGVDVT